MTALQALLAFALAAGLLTITPGLDTALVLRTAAVEGPNCAALAGLGVVLGCLVWGGAVALGLGALLAASEVVFTLLKWAGAAYLVWLGAGLVLKPRKAFDLEGARISETRGRAWLRRGLLTNLLNPKVGVFYVSFLPQFLPTGVPAAPFMFLLACMHGIMGIAWFAALIAATQPLSRLLRRSAVIAWLDRLTGGIFLGFAAKLALEKA